MKVANVDGRAALVLGDEIADVATSSDGRFGPDPMAVDDDWDAFATFAATVTAATGPLDPTTLRNPIPHPRQAFAIASTTAAMPSFLQPGQGLETWIEGIGTIRNRCT